MARLTLAGMYRHDPALFSGAVLPEKMSLPALIDKLIRDHGDLYPYHQNPIVLKSSIGFWFETRAYDFSQMYDALHAKYNPIENYDRTEGYKDTLTHSGVDKVQQTLGTQVETKHTGTETSASTGTDTQTESGTDTTTHAGTEETRQRGTEGTELTVAAYDSDGYVPRENSTRTPNLDETRTPDLTDTRTPNLTHKRTPDLLDTRTPNLTDTSVNSGTDKGQTEYGHVETTEHHSRVHGNIGVTTNQQMIQAEVDMRAAYDLYAIIARLFEQEFLSQCYS